MDRKLICQYCGKADGIMEPKTRKAIRRYQKANHLRVTGTLTKGLRKNFVFKIRKEL